MPANKLKRCAIYTRKSSEEGLEQDFNSLHAQREACEAFVKSQAGEGWRLLKQHYDDGGLSGGTMERPALQRLLTDIREHQVDVVVVYKVDRLTRSLADFAKMVEIFDARGKFLDLKFDAQKLSRDTLPPDGALVIDCRLLRLDEGDALSRLVVGFGVGASQIDGEVRVYEVNSGAANELLDFKVHSDTGKMPGHAVTMGVGAVLTAGASLMGAAASGMMAGADFWRSMIRSQTNSMANRIVGFVSEYAATQGWVNQSQADLLYQPQSVQDAAKFFGRFK